MAAHQGSAVPGMLQARTLEWVAISFSNAWKWEVKVKSLSRVWPPATPWTAAYQAPLSTGFSRQEYWSGAPLPSPFTFMHSDILGHSPLGSSVHGISQARILKRVTIFFSRGSSQPRDQPRSPASLELAARFLLAALPGKPNILLILTIHLFF